MKKSVIILIVCALLVIYPANNFSLLIKENYFTETETKKGISYIKKLEKSDIKEAEKQVAEAEEIRNYVPKTNAQLVNELLKKLKKGKTTYNKVFSKTYFMGDSLMNGLESYGVLNEKLIYSQVSASLFHLGENYKNVIKKNPKVIILHYGLNNLGMEKESLDGFISMYTKYIKKIKKASPKTRIIISSIFPVDRDVATNKLFGRIKAYNKAMKKMCKKLDVDYLNNDPLFKKIDYCYGRDGIHLPEHFYRDYWLRYVIKEMEIV